MGSDCPQTSALCLKLHDLRISLIVSFTERKLQERLNASVTMLRASVSTIACNVTTYTMCGSSTTCSLGLGRGGAGLALLGRALPPIFLLQYIKKYIIERGRFYYLTVECIQGILHQYESVTTPQ